MVTTRGANSFADLQKLKSKEWFDKFGRNDISWIQITETKGSDGRLTGKSETTTTIIGDLQFDVKLLAQYIQLGIAQSGDAIFYTVPEHAIQKNNEISVDSIRWRLVSQVEGEQTGGETIYQGWICRRSP